MDNNDPGILGADKSKLKYKFPEFNVNAPKNILPDSYVEDQEQYERTCFIQIPKSISGYDYVPYDDEYRIVDQSCKELWHQFSKEEGLGLTQLEIELPENEDNKITKEVEELADAYFNGKTKVKRKLLKAITKHLCSEPKDCAKNPDDKDEESEDEDSEHEIVDLELEEVSEEENMDLGSDSNNPANTENMDLGSNSNNPANTENMDLGSDPNNPANTDDNDVECIDLVSDSE